MCKGKTIRLLWWGGKNFKEKNHPFHPYIQYLHLCFTAPHCYQNNFLLSPYWSSNILHTPLRSPKYFMGPPYFTTPSHKCWQLPKYVSFNGIQNKQSNVMGLIWWHFWNLKLFICNSIQMLVNFELAALISQFDRSVQNLIKYLYLSYMYL